MHINEETKYKMLHILHLCCYLKTHSNYANIKTRVILLDTTVDTHTSGYCKPVNQMEDNSDIKRWGSIRDRSFKLH
jgi:hypothetical protein